MTTLYIPTRIGEIFIKKREVQDTIPIIFLHGVYYDHHLWDDIINNIQDRTILCIDMPLHGYSTRISKKNWTLEDCAGMLTDIIDYLNFTKVVAIGHSWGSMTVLRAANTYPERFAAIGLLNMPYQAAGLLQKIKFTMQHLFLYFRTFYGQQAAKTLLGKETRMQHPELIQNLIQHLNQLPARTIRYTDKAVILSAEDTEEKIQALNVPAMGLNGKEDYVKPSKYLKTMFVDGGHVSPLEAPAQVRDMIQKVLALI